ncbi:class I SAM-dependent methyltransferase [Streptomyces natalensis]|uniref:class I SAM-dependent methyltransferase n=1 Tax=Streptomyces natalensis TaxID=68242 RepID=UPI0005CAF6A9
MVIRGSAGRVATKRAPSPAAEAFAGMALSVALITGVRLGVFTRLAEGPAEAQELASGLGLDTRSTALLADSLHALGYLTRPADAYALSGVARRWLDPGASRPVAACVAGNVEHWDWWAALPEIIRTGTGLDVHSGRAETDTFWQDYIGGQYDLARLSAPAVSRAIRLPAGARRLLDVGGGHGWFAAELCRRHDGLQATVLDLPGSAEVGRRIIAETGMDHLVRHRSGDARSTSLEADHYDAALCFNLIHPLPPDDIRALLSNVNRSLRPGGRIAVLNLFARPRRRRPDQFSACLSLFFHMTSATIYTVGQLDEWLREAGFRQSRRMTLRRVPGQTLVVATKRA